jgi:uncharacterized membrane protein
MGSSERWRRAFVSASIVWAVTLPLATFAASRTPVASAASVFALGVYVIGSRICHQLPSRSFHLWATQMPVCARCAGIYAGAAVASIVAVLWRNVGLTVDARRLLAAAAIPTVATLAFEWGTATTPANWIRAAAGVPIGAAVAIVVVLATRGMTPGELREPRQLNAMR